MSAAEGQGRAFSRRAGCRRRGLNTKEPAAAEDLAGRGGRTSRASFPSERRIRENRTGYPPLNATVAGG
jgi:hypothetical protein